MFLKEYAIRRYGPLSDSGKRKLGRFNLFYGPNEEGKTLTIDALLKIMLGKTAGRIFGAVKRVDENPDGYLVVDAGNKKEIKLPGAGTLTELFGFNPSEFANIFVIRDSDLSISDEGSFYHGVTARLTGIRSDEIRNIKDQIHELGSITPGGDFENQAPLKLKDRFKKAVSLLEKIEPLFVAMEQEGFNLIEEQVARLEQDSRDLSEKLAEYSAAQGRERYEKGRAYLKKLIDSNKELEKLKAYSRDQYESWQRTEMSLEHLGSDLGQLDAETAEQKEMLAKVRSARQGKAVACRKAESELKSASEIIEPLLAEYDRRTEQLIRQESLAVNRYFNRATLVLVLLIFTTLAGTIIRPAWWFFGLLGASLIAVLLLAWRFMAFLRNKSDLKTSAAKICAAAEELGLPAEDIHAVRSGFGRLKSEALFAAESLSEANKELEWQQKELDRLIEQVDQKKRKINEIASMLERMRADLNLGSIDELSALLRRKQELKNEIDKCNSLLEDHFGKHGEISAGADRTIFWREQVEALSSYAQAAPALKYDRQTVTRLNTKIEEVTAEKRSLQEKMKERLDQLRDIEKETNELLYPDRLEYLPCQTTLDLAVTRQKLQEWIGDREEKRNVAGIALEILSELEAAEEQKVTALFGRNSPVSAYFKRITAGRYHEVLFESRDNPIKAVCQNGIELDAAKLSGGTFDQLYFAIRLALGEKLFEGDQGFFILDDPFVKADPVRLTALLEMLFEICSSGWQILYFSSKGEVKEALAEKIAAGEVSEFSIGLV